MVETSITKLLRHSVYLSIKEGDADQFTRLASNISDWDGLIQASEATGLSNILYSHLKACSIPIPENQVVQFIALAARHTRSNRDRISALTEILDEFDKRGIRCILLKGMALLHSLYDEKSQRPMGDMDILVGHQSADDAQQVLRDLGYNAGKRKHGYLFDHHHLPLASKNFKGLSLQVEIHHDALSGDAPGSITFESAIDRAQPVSVDGRKTSVLGAQDTLFHLSNHTFEPIENIKLGSLSDIYGYAVRYKLQIPWNDKSTKQSRINNTLRCLHYLSPLPNSLREIPELSIPRADPPSGVGKGFIPLSVTMNPRNSFSKKFSNLFLCSEWWMRVQYIVPPEKSLVWTRYITHPCRILFWFFRRLRAKLKSKLS